MKDCYKILGVSRNATTAEIRHAYRKKAKLLHPDITGQSSDAFIELKQAYDTLSDLKSRELFDESYKFHNTQQQKKASAQSFNYRQWLLERTDDESRAKLIIFDLLRNNEDNAVKEFKRMNMERPGFRLARWFTREDFMDFGFILSEELVLRQEYYDAVILLEQIIKMEYSYSYFRLFFPEVLSLARHILRNNIENAYGEELAIDAWERALEMRLGRDDDIYFLNRMSEAYKKMGDMETARICMEEAKNIERSKK
ncbi:MAG: J domain-containing protein [Treponema sp.]|nr:J domain-containing protein [Treponema sp.]